MASCEFRNDAWDSRCIISSTPCSDPFLVRASNSNAGSISRSGSHKGWISHTRWDGNLLNLNKELNWYTAHCHRGWCRDEVLHLNSNGIYAKVSTGIVCKYAVVLRSQQNGIKLWVNCKGRICILEFAGETCCDPLNVQQKFIVLLYILNVMMSALLELINAGWVPFFSIQLTSSYIITTVHSPDRLELRLGQETSCCLLSSSAQNSGYEQSVKVPILLCSRNLPVFLRCTSYHLETHGFRSSSCNYMIPDHNYTSWWIALEPNGLFVPSTVYSVQFFCYTHGVSNQRIEHIVGFCLWTVSGNGCHSLQPNV